MRRGEFAISNHNRAVTLCQALFLILSFAEQTRCFQVSIPLLDSKGGSVMVKPVCRTARIPACSLRLEGGC